MSSRRDGVKEASRASYYKHDIYNRKKDDYNVRYKSRTDRKKCEHPVWCAVQADLT